MQYFTVAVMILATFGAVNSLPEGSPLDGLPVGALAGGILPAGGPPAGAAPAGGLPLSGLPLSGLPLAAGGPPAGGPPAGGLPLGSLPLGGLPIAKQQAIQNAQNSLTQIGTGNSATSLVDASNLQGALAAGGILQSVGVGSALGVLPLGGLPFGAVAQQAVLQNAQKSITQVGAGNSASSLVAADNLQGVAGVGGILQGVGVGK